MRPQRRRSSGAGACLLRGLVWCAGIGVVWWAGPASPAQGQEEGLPAAARQQAGARHSETLTVAVHLHSTISTGTLAPEWVLPLATQAGLDAVIFTDSALRKWEFGLPPLRGLVKKVVEQPSVMAFGARRYLQTLTQLSTPELLVLPGLEAAPAYYWSRSPFDRRGGQIRGWNQHLLIFGLEDQKAIAALGLDRIDPYHGNLGPAPYQRVIDAATARGGVVFWAHPETGHQGRQDSIEDDTDPYAHLLEQTTGYQGFAITYRDKLEFVKPGGVWDRLLLAYCRGQRAHPVWILGELDWRKPQERPLDQMVTMVRAPARTPAALLEALKAGRMWAVFRAGQQAPTLEQFDVVDQRQRSTSLGGWAPSGPLRIVVTGRRGRGRSGPAHLFLIRNGDIVHAQEAADEEFADNWVDASPPPKGFYRAIFEGPAGLIYTNPIFVGREVSDTS